jgi:hypothetical protein
MNNPVSEVLAIGRVPAALVSDVRTIAQAASLVSVIERALISVLAELRLTSAEIIRVRTVLEPQHKKVARIEQTVKTIDQRTAVIERTLLELASQITTAAKLLPNPDHDDRGPLLKAKDALTGP